MTVTLDIKEPNKDLGRPPTQSEAERKEENLTKIPKEQQVGEKKRSPHRQPKEKKNIPEAPVALILMPTEGKRAFIS